MNDPILLQRIDRARRRRISDGAMYKYEHSYRIYFEWMSQRSLTARTMTPIQFEEFVYDMCDRFATSTVRGMVTRIKAAYTYDRQLNPATTCPDPLVTYRLPSEPDERPRVLSIDELRAVRDACKDETERTLFYLMAYTGCRIFEIRHLKWSDIDFENRCIDILGKGSKRRFVPLHPELARQLRLIDEDRREMYVVTRRRKNVTAYPLHKDSAGWIVEEITARAGVKDATSHAFRRTVATGLLRDGARHNVLELTVEKIMGWAPRTVGARHYYDVAPEDMLAAIHVLYPEGL